MRMRRKSVAGLSLLVGVLAITAIGMDSREPGSQTRHRMEGTWEHGFVNAPEHRQVKVITKDHFIWVTYDRDSKLPLTCAGGSCSFQGDTYREVIEFGQFSTDFLQKIVGKEQVFKVAFEGDRATITGTLSNGMELREVWTRVKPPSKPEPGR